VPFDYLWVAVEGPRRIRRQRLRDECQEVLAADASWRRARRVWRSRGRGKGQCGVVRGSPARPGWYLVSANNSQQIDNLALGPLPFYQFSWNLYLKITGRDPRVLEESFRMYRSQANFNEGVDWVLERAQEAAKLGKQGHVRALLDWLVDKAQRNGFEIQNPLFNQLLR
jgi:hypothetical protein